MPFTPFSRTPGESQGRILPKGMVPPEGLYAFCLGSDVPGVMELMDIGDSFTVEQVFTKVSTNTHIRMDVTVRGPGAPPPADRQWVFSITLGSTEHTRRVIAAGAARRFKDIGVSLKAQANSAQTVKCSLFLEAT